MNSEKFMNEFIRRYSEPKVKEQFSQIDKKLAEKDKKPKESKYFDLIYFKIFRKIVIIFVIILASVWHGLYIEQRRSELNWNASTIIELVLGFILLIDIVVLETVFIKFKGLFPQLFLALTFCSISTLIGLKIWGPPKNERKANIAVNIIRVFVILEYAFLLNEQNLKFENAEENNKIIFTNKPVENSNKMHVKKQERKNSLMKSSRRNSIEVAENKIIQEINNVLKKKFSSSSANSPKNSSQVVLSIKPQMMGIFSQLENLQDLNFNIFSFDISCYKYSLYMLMNFYYKFYDFEENGIDEKKYINLVFNIQKNYNDKNPYHNYLHGSDVANTLFVYLEAFELSRICEFTKIEKLIILLSGAFHDIDHPGNSNSYEINTCSVLSLTYNDKSVLENYHLFVFFNLLANQNLNIFSNFENSEMKNFRKQFISNVIATDLTLHSSEIKKFEDLLNSENFDPKTAQSKSLIAPNLVHFADISNPTKPVELYNEWIDRLFLEFFEQGDKEKCMKLPVSMFCDRETTKIVESQMFFITSYVEPSLQVLFQLSTGFKNLIPYLDESKSYVEQKLK